MTRNGSAKKAAPRRWGISPRLRYPAQFAVGTLFLLASARLDAAFTEPRLALMRVTPYRSSIGVTTLKLDGSFSYADAVQLALPLNVVVTQGQLTARFDLAGHVFTSTGGPEQPAPGAGVVSFAPREIVVALPVGFSSGPASAQVVADYEGKTISSNRLSFTL